MKLDDLTPEQIEKARACASANELVSLAKEEGLELTDEQLESVAGGDWDEPLCGDLCSDLSLID